MKLLPQSLLWRTMLLLALLLVAGNFAWLQIFRVTEREPRAAQIAQQIASVVNLTRSALITANPAKRFDLLRDLAEQEGIQVYANAPNEPVEPPTRPAVHAPVAGGTAAASRRRHTVAAIERHHRKHLDQLRDR